MSIEVFLGDGDGKGLKAHVHQKGIHAGLIALTTPLFDTIPVVRPLLNSVNGADMNKAVSFSGSPELIHDGGDNAGWTGTGPSTWDFANAVNPQAGTACVAVTSAANGDTGTFLDGGEIAMGTHEAISGQVRLDTYDASKNSMIFQFRNNGGDVGNTVNLNDFIDTGTLGSYQGFVIPKADMGVDGLTVDELTITFLVTGPKPTVRFDVMQIEDDGAPLRYAFDLDAEEEFFLHTLKFVMADNVTAVSDPSNFFSISALTNGIVIDIHSLGSPVFSGSFRRTVDFINSPFILFDDSIGAANSWMSFTADFPEPVILRGNDGDHVSLTIQDDLSSLTFFRATLNMTKNIPLTT